MILQKKVMKHSRKYGLILDIIDLLHFKKLKYGVEMIELKNGITMLLTFITHYNKKKLSKFREFFYGFVF